MSRPQSFLNQTATVTGVVTALLPGDGFVLNDGVLVLTSGMLSGG